MSIASDSVAFFRTEWADRLVDVATVYTPVANDDRGILNSSSLQYEEQTRGVVAAGVPCLARPTGSGEDDSTLFGQEGRTYTSVEVFMAHDVSAAIDLDDEVELTASVNEPLLIGKRLIIRSIVHDSYNTRRLFVCELDLGSGLQV